MFIKKKNRSAEPHEHFPYVIHWRLSVAKKPWRNNRLGLVLLCHIYSQALAYLSIN